MMGRGWSDAVGSQRRPGLEAVIRSRERGAHIFPRGPQKGAGPVDSLTGLEDLKLPDCERTRFCCFKLPCLWYFARVALGNK